MISNKTPSQAPTQIHTPTSAIIEKYAQHAPRYTSYPTALKFSPIATDILTEANENSDAKTLSLYVHIPFCKTLCYYCGCNKIVTRHSEKADVYLRYVEKEILSKTDFADSKPVVSLHLGGGSPSFLSESQHAELLSLLKRHFTFEAGATLSIELDPRNVTKSYLNALRQMGYNRVSFGLQDVDFNVQQTINRVQSTSHIADLVFEARTLGFDSINLDLIYGLPHQSLDTFKTTIAATKAMAPDRISLFSYAHLPERFAAQRKFANSILPDTALKSALYNYAVTSFSDIGYKKIGLDHFAKPSDELAQAQQNGVLHRNFQGYTTHGDSDLLGLGLSSISAIGNAFAQNPKKLNDYYYQIDNNLPAATLGLKLSKDDIIRRDVITSLMCNMKVNIQEIEKKHAIVFNAYFKDELTQLKPLQEDDVVSIDENFVVVPEHARIYVRAVCVRFDAYFDEDALVQRYSKAI